MNRLFHLQAAFLGLLVSLGCVDQTPSSDERENRSGDRGRGGADASGQAPAVDDWPIFRGNSSLRGFAPGTLPSTFEIKWSFETGGAIASSPIVVDGRVFVGSDDGCLYCVNLEDGSEVWKVQTEDIIEAPPLYHDGMVYIGASDFFIYALDAATGELKWKKETGDTILGGANVVELEGEPARIVVGSYDASLYCFDAKSGEQLWTFPTQDRVNGTPAVIGERIIFGGCDSILYIVNGADGTESGRRTLGADCHIAGSVGVDDGIVYFGHYGNALVAVDLKTLEPKWVYDQTREGFFSAPAIGETHVVIGGRDSMVHCVDRATGEGAWTFETRRKVDGSPIICDGKVVFGSGDGRLYVLELATGEELWTYDLGRPIFSSPAVVNGMIIIGCGDKCLYAFHGAE